MRAETTSSSRRKVSDRSSFVLRPKVANARLAAAMARLAAVGFNVPSIDVVRRDRLNRLALHDCFHRVFSLCENFSENEVVTTTRVNELYVINASAVPGQ